MTGIDLLNLLKELWPALVPIVVLLVLVVGSIIHYVEQEHEYKRFMREDN